MGYTSVTTVCAKNCCKRTIFVQLIIKDKVKCFLRHSIYTAFLIDSLARLNRRVVTFLIIVPYKYSYLPT